MNACNYIKHCILNDQSLPVNVEACIALQEMLTEDEIEINTSGWRTSCSVVYDKNNALF